MCTTSRIGFSSFLRLSNRLAACVLFALLVIAPSVGAQVRFADTLHGPKRDMAAEKQALVEAIGRGELNRVVNSKPKQPTSIPDPNLLGMPHWTAARMETPWSSATRKSCNRPFCDSRGGVAVPLVRMVKAL